MRDFEESLPPPPLPSLPPEAPGARRRRIIAIGGSRGGVGKSVLSLNLGVFFAQLGREVVLCDANPFGSSFHELLGLERPALVTPMEVLEGKGELVSTSVPGLRLLPIASDPMTGAPMRPTRAAHWLKQIATVNADYVLFHLGAATTSPALDLFLNADLALLATSPDPVSIESTYRFLRALYFRALRRAIGQERFKLQVIERVLADLPPFSSPRQIITEVRRHDEGVALQAAEQLVRLRTHLVVSQTRVRSDLEVGAAMAAVANRFLGITIEYIGHVEHDNAVWLTTLRKQPLLIESPTAKAARNIERVARKLLALLTANESRTPDEDFGARIQALLSPPPPPTLYDVLSVTPSATDDEIRRAHKRQREVFSENSLPITSIVPNDVLKKEQGRLDEAHETLLDAVRRRAYDLATFPDKAPESVRTPRLNDRDEETRKEMQAELAREIHPDTEYSGALLRRVREALGIELSDISRATKISITHLLAIEEERPTDLPAMVYIQGFVQQVAKCLKLDPFLVSKTYMRRLREENKKRPSRNMP